jgi:hypothetical protein
MSMQLFEQIVEHLSAGIQSVNLARKPCNQQGATMQSIVTKYLGPTTHRGSRIRATGTGGATLTLPFNHVYSDGRNHAETALELCRRLGWTGELVQGCTRDGYVFVFDRGERFAV